LRRAWRGGMLAAVGAACNDRKGSGETREPSRGVLRCWVLSHVRWVRLPAWSQPRIRADLQTSWLAAFVLSVLDVWCV
jgi:hypothetical protein